ncbi:hypothetical protein J2Z48_000718 [Croceifilum oryzae]|uniref:Uncharacterized protein n=1 Tax=Croceifilum oryzae TaxID=1553429 RepID=A0AAJ1TKV3_9BACL|nr:hypothetical protein [Croceifilum oryzae]MDQ0416551.1 hypothetical protein [Croceifilum oryzae]
MRKFFVGAMVALSLFATSAHAMDATTGNKAGDNECMVLRNGMLWCT